MDVNVLVALIFVSVNNCCKLWLALEWQHSFYVTIYLLDFLLDQKGIVNCLDLVSFTILG